MQRKITKAERRLLITSIGAIALLGVVALFRVSINATPQIVIPPYPKAPNPNGYDVYIQAAKMIVPDFPHVDRVRDPNPPKDEKTRAQKYSLQNKERWLKQNAAGFSLFQKALKTKCLPPQKRSDDVSFLNASFRELARSKSIEVRAREMSGNRNGAMQSRLDIVQMGTDVGRGEMMNALVGVAIQAIGRDNSWSSLSKLDALQTRTAIQRIEKIYERRILYSDVVQEEKWSALTRLQTYLRMPEWRTNESWFWEKPNLTQKIKMFALSKQTVVDDTIQVFDVAIANAKQTYNLPKQSLPAVNPVSEMMSSIYDTSRWIFARNDAANAMWLVALALHAHKLEHKSFPSTLRVLEGKVLKAIPADPFGGGEPLRYKRVGESYVLWSIGPDKSDNGGKAISYEKNASPEQRQKPARVNPESKGDYVWGKNQ